MIKPGTPCYIINMTEHCQELIGHVITVIGPPRLKTLIFDKAQQAMMYPIKPEQKLSIGIIIDAIGEHHLLPIIPPTNNSDIDQKIDTGEHQCNAI